MATIIPSIAGGQIEKFAPGDRITCTVAAGQTVRGGRLVEFTANRTIREAQADSLKVCGVALYNGAAGEKVTVATEGVWLLIAAGAIAAGDLVKAGAAGVAVALAAVDPTNVATLGTGMTDTRAVAGRAWEAIADTASGPIKLGGMV